MNSSPLKYLIENRVFDQYQKGLESRFRAYQLEYKLAYCEPTNKSAMCMDFENEKQYGRITVWVSGECDMKVHDKLTSEKVFGEIHQYNSEKEFFEGYPRLIVFMREAANA